MTGNLSLPKVLINSLDKEVRNQLELTRVISHPGESGRARENIVAAFIRKLIPQSFGIDTGFVIDSQGKISRQVDIVIYRTDYHPVFEIGGVKHFIVESVVAVIENKASIASTTQLKDAWDSIASVKRLDRTRKGQNIILAPGLGGGRLDPENFAHQVFGCIITQNSLTRENFVKEFLELLKNTLRKEWANIYVDVNSFAASYIKKGFTPSTGTADLIADPREVEYFYISKKDHPDFIPPLGELAQELVNFLRVASLVDFSPSEYLWKQTGSVDWHKI